MFLSSVDIANRALQHCGLPRLDAALGFSENSQRAAETSFAYGKVKRAELRRTLYQWATRRAALRPLDTNTMVLQATLWQSGTTYFRGSIVEDQDGFFWISKAPNNTGNQPSQSYPWWEPYFGPLTVMLYDSTATYFAGELTYTAPGDGTYNVYLSMISGNGIDPSLPNQWSLAETYYQNEVVQLFPAWSSGTTYSQGQTITYTDNNTYSSLTNSNTNNIPSATIGTQWALMPVLQLAPSTTGAVPAVGQPQGVLPQKSPVSEWNGNTSYSIGAYVMFKGNMYVSLVNTNSGNYPNAAGSTSWVQVTNGTSYMSLIDLNVGNSPASAPALWSSITTYALNALVGGSDGIIYKSKGNGNVNHNPVTDGGSNWTNTGNFNPWTTVFTQGAGNQQWMQIGGASFPAGVGLATPNIVYPLGSGPSSDSQTRNVYRLPAGYLRQAPQDPKAGSTSWLGAPSGRFYDDWEYEGNYFVSRQSGAIIYRFGADVVDVTMFDDMFSEGLALRLAVAVVYILTQSVEKEREVVALYDKFMREGRAIGGIETGPTEPPEDDYVVARL